MRYLPAEPLADPSNVSTTLGSSRLQKLDQLRKPSPDHAALRKRKLDEVYDETEVPQSQTSERDSGELVVGGTYFSQQRC